MSEQQKTDAKERWAALPPTAAMARAVGATQFYTGRPCKYGHDAPRLTSSGNCRVCLTLRVREREKASPEKHRERQKNTQNRMRERRPVAFWAKGAVSNARIRAARSGVPFALTTAFLVQIAPDTCPVLGIKLAYDGQGGNGGAWNSPSVDRFVPALGYVPGNVVVISKRANSIKSDATSIELAAVAAWLAKMTSDEAAS